MNLAVLFGSLSGSCAAIAGLSVAGAPIPPYVTLGLLAASIVLAGLATVFRSPISNPPG